MADVSRYNARELLLHLDPALFIEVLNKSRKFVDLWISQGNNHSSWNRFLDSSRLDLLYTKASIDLIAPWIYEEMFPNFLLITHDPPRVVPHLRSDNS